MSYFTHHPPPLPRPRARAQPYPSNYLTSGGPLLPAWPVRAACAPLADPALASGDPWALLSAFRAGGDVFNNATRNIACYDVPADYWLDGICA
jgi:lysosomal Pro-X carboxypeptidase